MRVVTYNINGIRASGRKGIENWLIQTSPEIVCFQEVRASEQQLRQVLFNFLLDYELFFNPGNRAGYSGVAVLIKKGFKYELKCVKGSLPSLSYDLEGRVLVCDFGKFVLINVYVPNGSRLEYKMEFLRNLKNEIKQILSEGKKLIVVSDFNIAHTEEDVSFPKSARLKTGFLDEERLMFDEFLDLGLVDTYRIFNSENAFSWSSYRAKQGFKNAWTYRFDYIFISENLKDYVKNSNIFLDVFCSDHFPVYCDFAL